MKVCFKCETEKPLTEFYKHSAMKDGYLNKCKECAKKDVHKNRTDNLEHYRAYDRKRSVLPHRAELRKKVNNQWQMDGRRIEVIRKYREKYPEKYKALTAVSNALKSGVLIRPNHCDECGRVTKNIEAHHDDYSKPLEVRWLCFGCHAKTRRIYPREDDGGKQ